MKALILCLILAGSLMAGDRRDDSELDNDLWFIWQEQKHANDQAERDAECRRCIQQHLANDESLSWALQVCPCD
jgi:hypothetical protein